MLRNNFLWLVFVAAIVALATSCQSTPAPEFDSKTTYKYDMRLEVNDIQGNGVLVLPQAAKYKIKLKAKAKIDLLTIRNCHRAIELQNAYQDNGIFSGKKIAKIEITPNSPIEQEYCPMYIIAFDINGRHTFALLDFKNPKFQLSIIHNCNGKSYVGKGVSFCQAYQGTYQEIKLPEVSEFRASTPECEFNMPVASSYRYEIKKGTCVYAIRGKVSGKFHRLTTIGYEKIIIKE